MDLRTYNNYNLITRYWKKIIAYSNVRFDDEVVNNRLFFLNQLIYRTSELKDDKLKKTLVNNFFKTRYFQERPLEFFEMRDFGLSSVMLHIKIVTGISIVYSISTS